MDWDQIESKWAAMARRIRADVQYLARDAASRNARRSKGVDSRAAVSADRQLAEAADVRSTLPPK